MLDPKVVRALQTVEWEKLIPRLTRAAILLAKRYHSSGQPGSLPKGRSPEDIVKKAIKKLYLGERKWNPEQVDLEYFLYRTISSLMFHLHDSAEVKRRRNVESPGEEEIWSSEERLSIRSIRPPAFESPDGPIQRRQIIRHIRRRLQEPITRKVFAGLLQGKSRLEIVEEIGVSLSTVDRCLRKIRTIAKEIMFDQI